MGKATLMTQKFLFALLFLFFSYSLLANDYEKAWEALHKNKRKEAYALLEKAMSHPATMLDATITYIYLQTYSGKERETKEFYKNIMPAVKDVNPYLFALWFNESVIGNYGKKSNPDQLQLFDQLSTRKDINGSLKAAGYYMKGLHFLYSNQFEKAKASWQQVGSLLNWQFTGPFENLSGTGVHKSYGPLENPKPQSEFVSLSNAKIKWFTPAVSDKEAWVLLHPHLPFNTSVSFAQTFVYAPADMDIYLQAGVNGSIKVWVNDVLKIVDVQERVTEIDYYKSKCKLKKGYNRILLQVGATDNAIANFIIRLTDENSEPVAGITSTTEFKPYAVGSDAAPVAMIKHFAEAFFEEKIKSDPDNWINYILLSQTYLRNKKIYEARKIIQLALKKQPDNSLLHFELIQCLLKDKNRTLLSREAEWFKENDGESLISYSLKIENVISEEKYEDALKMVEKMVASYGEDEDAIQFKIKIANLQSRTEDALKLIQDGYRRYPNNLSFVQLIFDYYKNSVKNIEEAIKVYELYLRDNFDYQTLRDLGEEYIALGKKSEGMKKLETIHAMFPYDADFVTVLTRQHFEQQDYVRALEYADQCLAIAPFVANYWSNKAVILEQLGRMEEAAASYKKSLYFDPQGYESHKKLRAIEKKQDLYKVLPERDLYEYIRKFSNNTISPDYDYSYLLDEKMVIVYAESAIEEHLTYVIKINTTNGIDQWKESYIPYNEYTQSLLIERAEIVKKNGGKIQAEQSNNNLVFTTLEVGDVVIIKYRLQNYISGRLSKEYFDSHIFSSFNPVGEIKYSLLVPEGFKFEHKMINSSLRPQVRDVEGYKLYTWEVQDPQVVKAEPFMPSLADVGAALYISTLQSWSELAKWYSDISYVPQENDYEVREVFDELFPQGEKLTDIEKAKRIYNYIEKNIRYSSVSFRQSAYVPQKTAVTLNTRLGDCKDLSSLFVSLAKIAGVEARLVLVKTRDNGTEIPLPALEFNHCIILLKADGKEYYLEMTDNYLPFGSLPYNLPGSSSLVIPAQSDKDVVSQLKPLQASLRTVDVIKRTMNLSVENNADLVVSMNVERTGALTSASRESYGNLTEEKMLEEMEKSVSSGFKNPVKVQSVSFKGLDSLGDKISYAFSYKVKNEVIEVGDMQLFKIPFSDVIATVDNFVKDARVFRTEYWRYETVDRYETTVTVNIPAGKKVVDLPKTQEFKFKKNRYLISYQQKQDGKVVVERKAELYRDDIAPVDYPAFKEFLSNIVKAESKYIAFK